MNHFLDMIYILYILIFKDFCYIYMSTSILTTVVWCLVSCYAECLVFSTLQLVFSGPPASIRSLWGKDCNTTRPYKHGRVDLLPCQKWRLCSLLAIQKNTLDKLILTWYQKHTVMYIWSMKIIDFDRRTLLKVYSITLKAQTGFIKEKRKEKDRYIDLL